MRRVLLWSASLALAASSACLVPPVYERASFGPPPEYWQDQGRYRQAGNEEPGAARAPGQPEAIGDELARTDPMAEGAPLADSPSHAPLHAWDGGVVDGAPQGRVIQQEGTPRGVETPPAGRMHIIELYQQALDERDALAQEVDSLRRELAETSLALEAKTKAADELTARVAALDEAHRALLAENQALAGRAVQAQIRRLEAEKLLLETRIESERAKAEEAARAAAAQARQAKPRAPKNEGEQE